MPEAGVFLSSWRTNPFVSCFAFSSSFSDSFVSLCLVVAVFPDNHMQSEPLSVGSIPRRDSQTEESSSSQSLRFALVCRPPCGKKQTVRTPGMSSRSGGPSLVSASASFSGSSSRLSFLPPPPLSHKDAAVSRTCLVSALAVQAPVRIHMHTCVLLRCLCCGLSTFLRSSLQIRFRLKPTDSA